MKSDCLGEWSPVRSTVVGVDWSFDNLCRNHHQRWRSLWHRVLAFSTNSRFFQDFPHVDHQISPKRVLLVFKSSIIQVNVGFSLICLILTSTQLDWKGVVYSSFQRAESNFESWPINRFYARGARQQLTPFLTNSVQRQVCGLKLSQFDPYQLVWYHVCVSFVHWHNIQTTISLDTLPSYFLPVPLS